MNLGFNSSSDSLESIDSNGFFFHGGNSPVKFLRDCLKNSIQYKRAAGYFSSSFYIAANESIPDFVNRGGIIRLICSPRLLPEDLEAIETGQKVRMAISDCLEREIHSSLQNESTSSSTRLLGKLVANGNMEIKIAVRENYGNGIFHSKVGIFQDTFGGKVGFCGSTNETWSGWAEMGNSESFISKSTYHGYESQKDVALIEDYFDQLWNSEIPDLVVRNLPDVPRHILESESAGYRLEELYEDLSKVKRLALNSVNSSVSLSSKRKTLMIHQKNVLDSWRAAGNVGIIDHVTGAGKTVTALSAIRDWISHDRSCLIVVPSKILQEQWLSEIRLELDIEPLLCGGELGKKNQWMNFLADTTRDDSHFGPRIVLSVLGTASTDDFIRRLQVHENLLVVADEVHTVGQAQCKDLLFKIKFAGARLGLSATYQRFGDPDGTSRIESVFGKPLLPGFSISDAISSGRLVPYDYFYEEVSLTDEEQEEFEKLTKQIQQASARESGGRSFNDLSSYLQSLIFKRSGILKGAANKSQLAARVLQERYKVNQNWLIYCDDTEQLFSVREALMNFDFNPQMYFDAMPGSKRATLENFSENGGILLAIKCLDEGVDIPSATHALILASSQNPREYIQRRGRVLRTDSKSGKFHAEIIDTIVVNQSGIPLNIREVERMIQFAEDADNSSIKIDIQGLISRISIDEGEISDMAFEEIVDLFPGDE